MTSRFKDAVNELIARHEGGYVDDPADSGGETKYGISKAAHPGEDIAAMTRERAVEIYWRDYWKPHEIDRMPGRVGEKFFHTVVNMRPALAVTILQRALRAATGEPLADDGVMGPKTRGALNGVTARGVTEALLVAFRSEQASFYRTLAREDPSQEKFLKGWLNRAYA